MGEDFLHAFRSLASHRGVSTNQLSLRDRELEISADESVLVDARGRLVVNWPFNRQQTELQRLVFVQQRDMQSKIVLRRFDVGVVSGQLQEIGD